MHGHLNTSLHHQLLLQLSHLLHAQVAIPVANLADGYHGGGRGLAASGACSNGTAAAAAIAGAVPAAAAAAADMHARGAAVANTAHVAAAGMQDLAATAANAGTDTDKEGIHRLWTDRHEVVVTKWLSRFN